MSESEEKFQRSMSDLFCPSNEVIKSDEKRFRDIGAGLPEQVMLHFTSNDTDQRQIGSSNLLAPYREQNR